MSLTLMDAGLNPHKLQAGQAARVQQGAATLVVKYRTSDKRIGLEVGAEVLRPVLPWAYEIYSDGRLIRNELVAPDRKEVLVDFKLPLASSVGTVPVRGAVRGEPGEVVKVNLAPKRHPAYSHADSISRLHRSRGQYWLTDWSLGVTGLGALSYGTAKLIVANQRQAAAASLVDPKYIGQYTAAIEQAGYERRNGWVGLGVGGAALTGAVIHHLMRTRTHRERLAEKKRAYDRVRTTPVDMEALRR